MNVGVSVRICEKDSAVCAVVCEGVEEVGQLGGGDLLRVVSAREDVPVAEVGDCAIAVAVFDVGLGNWDVTGVGRGSGVC